MSNQLTRFNRVRYRIYGNAIGVVSISEPGGWLEDEKELIRSDKYFGITANLSNSSLQFYGRAFIALKSEYDINGIKAVVRIEREERNENTDIWELNYSAYFDFSTYKQNKNYIQIKLNESEFFKNIESRFKDTFELERLTDLKGGVLQPLIYKDLDLQGREIFRETFYSVDETKPIPKINYKGSSTYDALQDIALPLHQVYKSDENFVEPLMNINSGGYVDLLTAQVLRIGSTGRRYNAGNVYYLVSDRAKQINITVNMTFRAKYNAPGGASARCRFYNDTCINNGVNIDSIVETLIYDINSNFAPNFTRSIQQDQWKEFTMTYTTTLDLVVGNSLGLRMEPAFSGSYSQSNQFQFEFSKLELKAEETQPSIITRTKALTYYQVFERLFQIITGKNTFSSDLLLDKWKDLLFTNGFKIRQFPQNTNKNISTSLEEVYNSLNSIDDIGLFIKNNTIKVEQKQLAFQTIIGLDLGEVSNIERNIEEKLHYSTIEIGNDFDGVYEEVNGLDEYNIRTSYVTCLDSLDNKFSAISKVRFDAYGMTLAQDKLYVNNPKLDTKYDKNNFAIDCKIENGVYVVRHWQDDFATQPTGIFSPDTAFNLRLSPFNSVLRKAKTISIGLQKYPNELFQYSSTEGNSQLVTLYPERAIVQNNVLPVPYILPETISFEKEISMAQFKQIVDYPYNLIKFVNELGLDEYGFIYPSVKPNKEGKFILIKANI